MHCTTEFARHSSEVLRTTGINRLSSRKARPMAKPVYVGPLCSSIYRGRILANLPYSGRNSECVFDLHPRVSTQCGAILFYANRSLVLNCWNSVVCFTFFLLYNRSVNFCSYSSGTTLATEENTDLLRLSSMQQLSATILDMAPPTYLLPPAHGELSTSKAG